MIAQSNATGDGPLSALEPLRLLVVEDDEVDRLTVRRLLPAAGFAAEVTECGAAEEAWEQLAQHRFDCVLLDFNLPRQDGLSLLRRLRDAGRRIPVVMLTAQSEPQIAADLMKSGATEYVSKTLLDAARLGQAVRSALRIARAEQELHETQEALRRSEAFNVRMLAASRDCIKVLTLDGALLSMSEGGRAALKIADVSKVEGTDWVSFWQGADADAARDALSRAREGGTGSFVGLCPATDGTPIWWHVVVTPIVGSDGRPEKLLCISRDVTEQRQNQEFEKQLVGIVSHDLRNPMAAIMVAADLLQRREELSDAAVRTVARIRSSADRAGRMVRDLLDFTQARLGGGIPVSVARQDLCLIAAQVVEEVRLSSPDRNIALHAPAELWVDCDADRIAQVISNLLSNALQYSPPQTVVSVRIGPMGDGYALLEVHNYGDAIPPDSLMRIFEPLQRASSAGDGGRRSIGLGLFIVEALVKGHGGRVTVQSDEATGTTFSVLLPLRSPGAPQAGV